MARTKNRYRTEATETTEVSTYRTGIYIRLSKERTESWRNKSQSLETQESLARTFAKEKGLTVVKIYTDYEYSGTRFNRPAFQEMMEDVKKGAINCILIRDLSRLGRDYIEMGRLIDKVFPFLGVRFVSINDHLDTLNGLEEKKSFEVEIKNLVNDLYSKDISKKVVAYHIHQASQGYFIGNRAAYGYRLDKQEQGIKLKIDPLVRPILRTVFERLIQGEPVAKVTAYLNQNRVAVPTLYRRTGQLYRSETDVTEWRKSTLQRLIKNPVYQGHLVQRRSNKSLSEADYIRFECAHEAYITPMEYDNIIRALQNRRSVKKRTQPKTPNRYKGLIYAKGNSRQMYRYCRHFSNPKSEYDYYYFTDYVYDTQASERQTVYISEIALDSLISELLQAEINRLGLMEQLLPKLQTRKADRLAAYRKQVKRHQQAVSRLREEISELYASYRLEHTEKAIYLTQKVEKEAQIETLSQEITHGEVAIRKLEEEYRKQVSWVKSLYQCQETEMLTSDLLHAVIERIEVDVAKQVTISFHCQIGGGEGNA